MRCSRLAPITATAIASSHMRTRLQCPMLTTSEIAPMVQKFVLLAIAPNTNASAKPPQTTSRAGLAPSTIR